MLEHDPEKWKPVFAAGESEVHAQTESRVTQRNRIKR
jgi:hypothetical protein